MAIVTGVMALLLLGGCIIIFLLLYQRRHTKQLIEKLQFQSQFHQTVLQSQLDIQGQTLRTISEEIHENIGQVLSLVKLNIGTMDINQPAGLEQKITYSRDLVSKAIQDLRDLGRGINSGYITERKLLRSIEYELDMIRKTATITTQLIVEGVPEKLDAQKEVILFCIFQEILNNIMKHAEATTITVRVTYEFQRFSITITDDGKGFDITLLDKPKNSKFGLALRNMKNKAQLVGAEFSPASIPEKGTSILISLPLR